MLRRSSDTEFLDQEHIPAAALLANLSDIRRLNRLFGDGHGVWKAILTFGTAASHLSFLDVGTGSADVPLLLRRLARRRGIQLTCYGLDQNSSVITEALRYTQAAGQSMPMIQGDARHLPLRDASIDVAHCSLTLHHFKPDDAILLLRELCRVSRIGIIVSDLYRSRTAYVAVWVTTRIFGRHAMTRHDGPLSVLRAYAPVELQRIAVSAGVQRPRVRVGPWFRMMLTARVHA